MPVGSRASACRAAGQPEADGSVPVPRGPPAPACLKNRYAEKSTRSRSQYNPGVVDALLRLGRQARLADDYLAETAAEQIDDRSIGSPAHHVEAGDFEGGEHMYELALVPGLETALVVGILAETPPQRPFEPGQRVGIAADDDDGRDFRRSVMNTNESPYQKKLAPKAP